jgi:hypothetical protein
MLHIALVRSAIIQHQFTPRKTTDDIMQEQLMPDQLNSQTKHILNLRPCLDVKFFKPMVF